MNAACYPNVKPSQGEMKVITCDHSCGGRPVRYAHATTRGFKCTRCGVEVITRMKPLPPTKANPLPLGVEPVFF